MGKSTSKNCLPELKKKKELWKWNLLIPWETQERDLSESERNLGLTKSSTVTAAKALILEDTVL